MDFGNPEGKLFAWSQAWKVESGIFGSEMLVGILCISMTVLGLHILGRSSQLLAPLLESTIGHYWRRYLLPFCLAIAFPSSD